MPRPTIPFEPWADDVVRVLAGLILLAHPTQSAAQHVEFEPSSSVAETLRQHAKLPPQEERAWWRFEGEDMAWNNRHLHQIVPTVNVHRDGPVKLLPRAPSAFGTDLQIDTPDGTLSLEQFLGSAHSSFQSLLVVHRGQVVFESYPRSRPHDKPIWWSVTKVLPATVLGILEDRGEVDTSRQIERYLPRLSGSDLAGATVRQILDMASGIDCSDGNYSDPTTCYMLFESSLGDAERTAKSPENPYDYLSTLGSGRWAPPGTGFDYSGVNTFVIGWLVEELTGMPFQDALSREIWTRMGAMADASILAGRNGVPLTSGGLLARVEDVARFGLLFTPSWSTLSDERIVSRRHVELLLHGGDPALLRRARWPSRIDESVRHNVYQWDRVFTDDSIYKGGWGGQGLLINPTHDIVVVWTGYRAERETLPDLPLVRRIVTTLASAEDTAEDTGGAARRGQSHDGGAKSSVHQGEV